MNTNDNEHHVYGGYGTAGVARSGAAADGGSTSATAARVAAGLDECGQRYRVAAGMAHRTDADWAERSRALALIAAREAGWWRVLSRAAYRDLGMDTVFGRAALIACETERNRARFFRDAAADWQARAEHRPTSDAAGALSNWRELGVTA